MKKLAITIIIIAAAGFLAACSSNGKGKMSYSGCQAQKTNNTKTGSVFLY